jgi:hypothetical protein
MKNQINQHCKCAFCIAPSWISKEDFIKEASRFLGYPKCCTKAFLKNIMSNKQVYGLLRHRALKKIANDHNFETGFVPCEYHADRILNQGKNVKRIFRNRICSTSFPYASTSEFKMYLRKLKKKYENNTSKN